MPPTDKHTKAENKTSWDTAAAALAPVGLHLPAYDKRGMVFVIDEHGRPRERYRLPKKVRPAALRKLIERLRSKTQLPA